MYRIHARSLGVPSVIVLTLAACSSGSHGVGSGLLPQGAQSVAAPFAKATPPVTAPVTIPYPYTSTTKTTTWKSATAKPVTTTSTDNGTITVQFSIDKKTGVYFVPEIIKSKTGYTESLYSAIGFQAPPSGGGIGQIIFSDNYTYVQGPVYQSGMDTYSDTQNSFDFPLTTGRRWSAAAAHNSFYDLTVSGSGAFEQNVTTNVASDGSYTGQTSFSSTTGSANQDNYASTIDDRLGLPSEFTIAEPAAGFNVLTQTFARPAGGKIAVTTSGQKPIPGKAGTVTVTNWYPKGVHRMYADNYLVTGTTTMPAGCGGQTGKTATHILETNPSLDPVNGTYTLAKVDYYMATVAKGQFWFACIVENITATTYANGFLMNAGSWGTPSSQAVTTETLVAKGVHPGADALSALPKLHVFEFVPPAVLHARLARLGLARR